MRRYAARIDPGQPAIVKALLGVGALIGYWGTNGAPDLVVAFRGTLFCLECKEPIGPKGGSAKRGQHLTPAQIRFHRRWGALVTVVRSPTEALVAIGAIKAA
jgi:hypothetical protein